MSAVFYIDGLTRAVSTVDPSATGAVLVEVSLPNDVPLALLTSQLTSLTTSLMSQGELVAPLVIRVTLGGEL